YIANADGSGVRRLSAGHSARWSPDGAKLVVSATSGSTAGDLFVVNADGSGRELLFSNDKHKAPAGWSPDGKRILFTQWQGADGGAPGSRPGGAAGALRRRTARSSPARVRIRGRQPRAGTPRRRGQARRRDHACLADRRQAAVPAPDAAPLRPLGDAPALAPDGLRALRAAAARRLVPGSGPQERLLPERRVRDTCAEPCPALDARMRPKAPARARDPRGDLAGLRRRIHSREGGPVDRRHRPRARPLPPRPPGEPEPDAGRALLCQQRGLRADRAARPARRRARPLPRFGFVRNLTATPGVGSAKEGGSMR